MTSHGKGPEKNTPHRVVIVGGGFGGLTATRALAEVAGVEVTLIDKRNFHLFQPLLYQVATGALSPGDIAAPLREALRGTKNVSVRLGEVTGIDTGDRRVLLDDEGLEYDTLIVAAGLVNNYFGRDEWERWAPGLKSIEDATEVRSRLLVAFEEAEHETDPQRRAALLTFVVVGAGPTGVEMAGAIAEIAADTLPIEFRGIADAQVRVLLVEAGPRVLATFPEKLSCSALRDLTRMGVEVRTSTFVREIDGEGVSIESAAAATPTGGKDSGEVARTDARERIDARVVVWAAGVRGSPLVTLLANATGAVLTRQGTVVVGPDLTLPGHPEIAVIGDAASFTHGSEKPLPGVAQVAIQQGRYVAKLVETGLHGGCLEPFRYEDRGSMATIGRAKAVAEMGRIKLTGFVAWMAWLFVHLLFLVGYENRILVLTQWAWYYVWRRRSARLITVWEKTGGAPTRLQRR